MRLALLGSTRGTHLLTLHEAILNRELMAEIVLIISNKQDALILKRAELLQLPHFFLDRKELSREEYDNQISVLCKQYQVDLIVLAGYLRILSATFVNKWLHKIINVHPSLLPKFEGLMDLAVHQAVIDAGEKISGCTVHYVTEKVDAGPIILQQCCAVDDYDTAQLLKEKVQALEKTALIEAIKKLLDGYHHKTTNN